MLNPKQPSTELGDINYGNLSSSQRGTVLPWGRGVFRTRAWWLSPAYNRYTRDPGRARGEHWFCNIVAGFCLGPVDRLYGFYCDGYFFSPGWFIDYSHPQGEGWIERNSQNPYYVDLRGMGINVYDPLAQVRVHWGVPGAPRNFLFESDGLGPEGEALPDQHPSYERIMWAEFRSFWMGINNPNRLTNVEVLVAKLPDLPAELGAMDKTFYHTGINPVTAVADWLTDPFGGRRTVESLDIPYWVDLSHQLAGGQYAINPYFDNRRSAEVWAEQMLTYFDGYVVKRRGLWQIGWIPPAGAKPEMGTEVPLFGVHDCTRPPQLKVSGGEELISKLVVDATTEWYPHTRSTPHIYSASVRRQRESALREKQVDRSWFLTSWAVDHWGEHALRAMSEEKHSGTVWLRRENAVRLDGERLMRGDLFYLADSSGDTTLLLRIDARRENYQSGEVELSVTTERGSFPQPYVEPLDPEPDLTLPPVTPLINVRLFELPWRVGLETRPSFAVLAERPDETITGADIWYSADNVDYTAFPLDRQPTWAIFGWTDVPISDSATELDVEIDRPDAAILEMGTDTDAADDYLLLFIGNEIISIADLQVISGGLRRLTLLRGRLGSLAEAHGEGDPIYITRRENLRILRHATITPGGQFWVKVQPRNLFQDLPLESEDITMLTATMKTAAFWAATISFNPGVDDGVLQWDPAVIVSMPRTLEITVTPGAEPLRSVHLVQLYADTNNPEVIPTNEDGTAAVLYEHYFADDDGAEVHSATVKIPAPAAGWTNLTAFVTDARGRGYVIYKDAWYFIHPFPAPSGFDVTPLVVDGSSRSWQLIGSWANNLTDAAEMEILDQQYSIPGNLVGGISDTDDQFTIQYNVSDYTLMQMFYGEPSAVWAILRTSPLPFEVMLVTASDWSDSTREITWTVQRAWGGSAVAITASTQLRAVSWDTGHAGSSPSHGTANSAYFTLPKSQSYVLRVWSLDLTGRRGSPSAPVFYLPAGPGQPSSRTAAAVGSDAIKVSWQNPSEEIAWDYILILLTDMGSVYPNRTRKVYDRSESVLFEDLPSADWKPIIYTTTPLGNFGALETTPVFIAL